MIDNSLVAGYGGITRVASDPVFGANFALVNEGPGKGPFTRFAAYGSEFNDGYKTSIKIYLDPNWSDASGFEYTVAANGADGIYQRDFVFHVTKDSSTGQLLVGGSNNATGNATDPLRQDLDNGNHSVISAAGWYRFEHEFYLGENGALEVAMNVYDASGNWVFSEVRNAGAADALAELGGNRYGWFTNVDVVGGLAIDDVTLTTRDTNPVQLIKGTGTQLPGAVADTVVDSFATVQAAVTAATSGNIIDLGAYTGPESVTVGVENLTFRGPDGSNVDLTLGGTVQTVTLAGAADIDVTGNASDNTIIANAGDNVIDGAGGIDTVSYAGASAPVVVDLSNTAGPNVSGGSGSDRLINVEKVIGTSGDDTFTGDGNANTFTTNGGSDTVKGGGGTDTVILPGTLGDYVLTVLQGGSGNYVFTQQAPAGSAVVSVGFDVEFAGSTDLSKNVFVLDAAGRLVGTYDTISAAVGGAVSGQTLWIKGLPSAYAENVTVDKALTFVGIDVGNGAPTVTPTSGTAFNLTAASGDITFDNIDIAGGATGIAVAGSAAINKLTVINGTISGASTYGLFVDGPGANPGSVADLVIKDMTFGLNGAGGASNTGQIKLWGFDGNARIENVTIAGAALNAPVPGRPDNAIEITAQQNPVGTNAPDLGTVVITGVTVTGSFHKNPVAVFNASEINGLSISGLNLAGATSDWGPLLNIDGIEDDIIDASGFGITFPSGYGIVTEIQGEKLGQDTGETTITGTSLADRLIGKTGNDILIGGAGNDQLYGADKPGQPQAGEAGNDRLEGGAGDDYLSGGAETVDGLATPSQGDVAVYRGTIQVTTANLSLISSTDPVNNATFQGWQVNATGLTPDQGTDRLNDVEIIENVNAGGTVLSRILLVGNGGFATVQAAINEARDGDTIAIAANTYVEQITVKNLNNITFVAVGGEVVIKAPADVIETARSSSDREVNSVVTVLNGTNIVFNDITVDGDGRGNTVDEGTGSGDANFTGILYRNASGSLIDVDIKGVRDAYEPGTVAGGGSVVSGMQRGVGLQVDNDTELAFTMRGGSITDFQKNATVFNKANLDVTGVTITGGGAQTIIAQNGIQVLNSTGTISGNTITKIGYAGSQNVYSGAILGYGNTGLAITNNTIVGANIDSAAAKVVGVYVTDFGPDNSGGRITDNIISYVDEGIDVSGDITPTQILIENNTVTNLDLADQYAAGVWHEPTAALTTVFDVKARCSATSSTARRLAIP